jgi:hypothetical protein
MVAPVDLTYPGLIPTGQALQRAPLDLDLLITPSTTAAYGNLPVTSYTPAVATGTVQGISFNDPAARFVLPAIVTDAGQTQTQSSLLLTQNRSLTTSGNLILVYSPPPTPSSPSVTPLDLTDAPEPASTGLFCLGLALIGYLGFRRTS